MEVICISEISGSTVDFRDNPVQDSTPNPKPGDICTVVDVVSFPDGDYYQLEEFDKQDFFHSRHFERTNGLQEEINFALKAKNPCIKKYSLHELDAIGYYIPGFDRSEDSEYWRKRMKLC